MRYYNDKEIEKIEMMYRNNEMKKLREFLKEAGSVIRVGDYGWIFKLRDK